MPTTLRHAVQLEHGTAHYAHADDAVNVFLLAEAEGRPALLVIDGEPQMFCHLNKPGADRGAEPKKEI